MLTACRAGCHGQGGGNRPALTCGLLLLKEETKPSLVITEATGSSKPFQALLPRNKWPVTGNKEGGGAPPEMGGHRGHPEGHRPGVWEVGVSLGAAPASKETAGSA